MSLKLTMNKLILSSILFCASFNVFAEKWVFAGNIKPTNANNYTDTELYADTDSAKRTGDLGKIKAKTLVNSKIEEFTFDCLKNTLIGPRGEQVNIYTDIVGPNVTWPTLLTVKLKNLACSQWFNSWMN